MKRNVSDENRQIIHVIDDAFGGEWYISEYSSADEHNWVNLLSAPDSPQHGLMSFCTVGLSDFHPVDKLDPPLGVEITAASTREEFGKVLISTAFYAIDNNLLPSPGTVCIGAVSNYLSETNLPHLLFLEPFLWGDKLHSRALKSKTVAWVMGVQISESEADYMDKHGFDALDDLFDQAQPDHFNLDRPSVV